MVLVWRCLVLAVIIGCKMSAGHEGHGEEEETTTTGSSEDENVVLGEDEDSDHELRMHGPEHGTPSPTTQSPVEPGLNTSETNLTTTGDQDGHHHKAEYEDDGFRFQIKAEPTTTVSDQSETKTSLNVRLRSFTEESRLLTSPGSSHGRNNNTEVGHETEASEMKYAEPDTDVPSEDSSSTVLDATTRSVFSNASSEIVFGRNHTDPDAEVSSERDSPFIPRETTHSDITTASSEIVPERNHTEPETEVTVANYTGPKEDISSERISNIPHYGVSTISSTIVTETSGSLTTLSSEERNAEANVTSPRCYENGTCFDQDTVLPHDDTTHRSTSSTHELHHLSSLSSEVQNATMHSEAPSGITNTSTTEEVNTESISIPASEYIHSDADHHTDSESSSLSPYIMNITDITRPVGIWHSTLVTESSVGVSTFEHIHTDEDHHSDSIHNFTASESSLRPDTDNTTDTSHPIGISHSTLTTESSVGASTFEHIEDHRSDSIQNYTASESTSLGNTTLYPNGRPHSTLVTESSFEHIHTDEDHHRESVQNYTASEPTSLTPDTENITLHLTGTPHSTLVTESSLGSSTFERIHTDEDHHSDIHNYTASESSLRPNTENSTDTVHPDGILHSTLVTESSFEVATFEHVHTDEDHHTDSIQNYTVSESSSLSPETENATNSTHPASILYSTLLTWLKGLTGFSTHDTSHNYTGINDTNFTKEYQQTTTLGYEEETNETSTYEEDHKGTETSVSSDTSATEAYSTFHTTNVGTTHEFSSQSSMETTNEVKFSVSTLGSISTADAHDHQTPPYISSTESGTPRSSDHTSTTGVVYTAHSSTEHHGSISTEEPYEDTSHAYISSTESGTPHSSDHTSMAGEVSTALSSIEHHEPISTSEEHYYSSPTERSTTYLSEYGRTEHNMTREFSTEGTGYHQSTSEFHSTGSESPTPSDRASTEFHISSTDTGSEESSSTQYQTTFYEHIVCPELEQAITDNFSPNESSDVFWNEKENAVTVVLQLSARQVSVMGVRNLLRLVFKQNFMDVLNDTHLTASHNQERSFKLQFLNNSNYEFQDFLIFSFIVVDSSPSSDGQSVLSSKVLLQVLDQHRNSLQRHLCLNMTSWFAGTTFDGARTEGETDRGVLGLGNFLGRYQILFLVLIVSASACTVVLLLGIIWTRHLRAHRTYQNKLDHENGGREVIGCDLRPASEILRDEKPYALSQEDCWVVPLGQMPYVKDLPPAVLSDTKL